MMSTDLTGSKIYRMSAGPLATSSLEHYPIRFAQYFGSVILGRAKPEPGIHTEAKTVLWIPGSA